MKGESIDWHVLIYSHLNAIVKIMQPASVKKKYFKDCWNGWKVAEVYKISPSLQVTRLKLILRWLSRLSSLEPTWFLSITILFWKRCNIEIRWVLTMKTYGSLFSFICKKVFSKIVLNSLKRWRKHLVSFSAFSFRPLIWLPQTPASLRKCRITPNDSALVCPRQDSLYQWV